MKVVSSTVGAGRFDNGLGSGFNSPAAAQVTPEALPREGKLPAEPPSWLHHRQVDQQLLLNRAASSQQAAMQYLKRLQEQAQRLRDTLVRRGARSDASVVERDRQGLSALLGQRVALAGGVLDGSLRPHVQRQPQAVFSVPGLETLAKVQAAGAETLLFDVGRLAGGPLVVVLDDHMGTARLLRRFNVALGPAGIQAVAGDEGALHFHIAEEQWPTLRAHLALRGEGRLLASSGFVPARALEHSFKQRLDSLVDLPGLHALVDEGLTTLARTQAFFSAQPTRGHEQSQRQSVADTRRTVLDYLDRVFRVPAGAAYDEVARTTAARQRAGQLVASQARLGRRSILALLS